MKKDLLVLLVWYALVLLILSVMWGCDAAAPTRVEGTRRLEIRQVRADTSIYLCAFILDGGRVVAMSDTACRGEAP